jgi:hypothetical protein
MSAIKRDKNSGCNNMFVMDPKALTCWITVDNLSIHLYRHSGGGVRIYAYPLGGEDEKNLLTKVVVKNESN